MRTATVCQPQSPRRSSKARCPTKLLGFDGVNMRQAIEDAQNWLAARDMAA